MNVKCELFIMSTAVLQLLSYLYRIGSTDEIIEKRGLKEPEEVYEAPIESVEIFNFCRARDKYKVALT